MIRKIALGVVVVVVAVLLFAATRPDSFRVERSASIKAPPEKVFALIDDFHEWRKWSPWENIDPNLKRNYGDSAKGKGATYQWEGDDKVGSGRMEIIDSASPSRIAIKLDFLKPFEAHNSAGFTLQAKGDITEITWAMDGPSNYITKLIGVFVSMDNMVGKDFETGLANMKAVAEK